MANIPIVRIRRLTQQLLLVLSLLVVTVSVPVDADTDERPQGEVNKNEPLSCDISTSYRSPIYRPGDIFLALKLIARLQKRWFVLVWLVWAKFQHNSSEGSVFVCQERKKDTKRYEVYSRPIARNALGSVDYSLLHKDVVGHSSGRCNGSPAFEHLYL